jgi:ribosome biogenesis protein ERB1
VDNLFNLRLFIQISNLQEPSYLCWHRKGDYFASVCTEGTNASVLVHQISKGKSQAPFNKLKGRIQRVIFHPNKPLFYVATQQSVRIYNLMKQEMIKKLQSGVKWISSIDIHPGGKLLRFMI